jgi:hypothetical protein
MLDMSRREATSTRRRSKTRGDPFMPVCFPEQIGRRKRRP